MASSGHNSSSLLGTFFYPWYMGKSEGYLSWNKDGHSPPRTWASNYLPDLYNGRFNPANDLYESGNLTVINRQLSWMKEAGIQFTISSWWGINHLTDKVFSKIINVVMPSKNNTYKDLKWALLYEGEGYGDPSREHIINELNYIQNKYSLSPYYLRIDKKPVLFVYNADYNSTNPLNDFIRWKSIHAAGNFYIVMKVSRPQVMEKTDPSYYDALFEYDPTKRYGNDDKNYAFVSPGYWRYDRSPLLKRNITDFDNAVANLSLAKAKFKLIETWNEWAEGTQIEPAFEVLHNHSAASFIQKGNSYGITYLEIIRKHLNDHT
jgi:hypothetical protein